MNLRNSIGLLLLLLPFGSLAQETNPKDTSRSPLVNFHFQLTTVTQHKFDMHAPYTGTNSLTPDAEDATTLTSTIFFGVRLWKNAALYINPELAGGAGISSAHGIRDFTNGEAFRVGDPAPKIYLARGYLRQTISLTDNHEEVEVGANQIYNSKPTKYIALSFGKFSIADFFDNNSYSRDPRSQFFNWGLMSNGGWDYPANVRGYTWGVMAEYGSPTFKIRGASVMVPTEANGNEMDTNIGQANSNVIEVELPFAIGQQLGAIRALGFYTNAHMGNYVIALQQNPDQPDITATRSYGRNKYGFGLNLEQAISTHAGIVSPRNRQSTLAHSPDPESTFASTSRNGSTSSM